MLAGLGVAPYNGIMPVPTNAIPREEYSRPKEIVKALFTIPESGFAWYWWGSTWIGIGTLLLAPGWYKLWAVPIAGAPILILGLALEDF